MNASQTMSKAILMGVDGDLSVSKPSRLLVVDDEPDICELLAEELTDQGYECKTASGVDEAIAIAQAFEPQAIISDVRMPYKTGLDLLQAVSISEKPVPVVLISGFTDVSLQQIYRLGAAALFSKPLNIEMLLAQVRRILSISSIPFGSRNSNRTPTEFPAKIVAKLRGSNEETTLQATVCNISRTGIYVQLDSNDVPEVGQSFSFVFHDPSTQLGVVRGSGICRWTHQVNTNDQGNKASGGFGAEFQRIDGDCFEALLNYVSQAGSFWSPSALATKPVVI